MMSHVQLGDYGVISPFSFRLLLHIATAC